MTFLFERPKSHKRMKDKAPEFPPADLDNLVKGVLDALAGIAYHNDRQVVRFNRMDRLYAERGETVITIGPANKS
jgi:Holliday junction resolvase RusA-like endonuclease